MSQNLPMFIEENEVFPRLKVLASREQIIERKRQAKKREIEQEKIFAGELIHKISVHAKLLRAGAREFCEREGKKWLRNFERCEVEEYVQVCEACEWTRKLKYRCSLKWCPCCNWRVSLKRKELLERMTCGMNSVKHVVLTQRNFYENLRQEIRASRVRLPKLRRQKVMRDVTGGCASLEFTNERRGWHLHWHILVQASWVGAAELSVAWGKLCGQDFAIVKVKDVSESSYLAELCKYVVSGAELARWTPEQILDFVKAIDGTRCFSSFGKFREMQKYARALIECEKPDAPCCEHCENNSFVFAPTFSDARRIMEKWRN